MGFMSSVVGAALALVVGVSAHARPLDEEKAVALMVASGASAMLDEMSESMGKGLKESMDGSMSPADQQIIAETYAATFTPDSLKSFMRIEMQASLSAEEADSLLGWYRSPIGRKFVAADTKPGGAAMEQGTIMRKGMDELSRTSQKRAGMYKEYVRISRQGELAATLVLRMTGAMAVAASKVQGMADPSILNGVLKKLEGSRPAIVDQMDALGFANAVLRYKVMSDAEVEALVAFEKTPAEQKFSEAVVKGLDRAMTSGMATLVEAIGEQQKRRPARQSMTTAI